LEERSVVEFGEDIVGILDILETDKGKREVESGTLRDLETGDSAISGKSILEKSSELVNGLVSG